jgi:hypothetical protein
MLLQPLTGTSRISFFLDLCHIAPTRSALCSPRHSTLASRPSIAHAMRVSSVEQRRTLNAARGATDKCAGPRASARTSAAVYDSANDSPAERAAYNSAHGTAARVTQRVITGILSAKVGS